LVKDLFGPDFADILERYPLAQAAAAAIRRSTDSKSEDAVPLERFLKQQMRDSANRFTRLRYRQIPLYLQHLLYEAGRTDGGGYTREPDNYNALINEALEFDDVLFLTLNYDTLLDDRLFIYWPLDSLRSYVASDPIWALVKLHGSVNWSRQVAVDQQGYEFVVTIENVNRLIDTPAELQYVSGIELHAEEDLAIRRFQLADVAYYPALSVPLGEEDEIVCPDDHVMEARQRLGASDGIHLLVIGYSGLDQEVLTLLRQSGAKLRSLLVANGPDEQAGFMAGDRIQRACGGDGLRTDNIFAGGFTDLVASGTLRSFLSTRP
jgi:hypothetical protein